MKRSFDLFFGVMLLLLLSVPMLFTFIAVRLTSKGPGIYFSNRVHPLPIDFKKLTRLFIIIVIYTLLIYPVFFLELWFFWKIIIKSLLLFSFVILCIKINYIEISTLKSTYNKIIKLNF